MLKRKLLPILLLVAVISASFTIKKPITTTSTVTGIADFVSYDGFEDGLPAELNLVLYTNTPETGWWKARVKVRMYFDGATGHWSAPSGPFRYWVPEWGWGYRTYQAEMAPGYDLWWTFWDLNGGEEVDQSDITILSWQPE